MGSRKIDDILDGEEVAREVQFADQRQLAVQRIAHAFGDTGRVAAIGTLPGELFQVPLRIEAIRAGLLGIFVAQLIKAEIAGIGHLPRGGNRMRPWREQALHFLRRLEVPFGIGLEQMPGPRHRGLVPDRGHHILQGAAMGGVVEHVVGGEDREAVGFGESIEGFDPGNVAAGVETTGGDVAQGGELGCEVGEEFGERCSQGS